MNSRDIHAFRPYLMIWMNDRRVTWLLIYLQGQLEMRGRFDGGKMPFGSMVACICSVSVIA